MEKMKEYAKKNFAILLAFALPSVLIIVVALSVYLPSLFITTDYDFIYTMCTDNNNNYSYRCNEYLQKRYSVADGKLVVNSVTLDPDINRDIKPDFSNYIDRIFLHDTKKNESREISLEEAKTMNLSGLLSSADGVIVSSFYNSGGSFFVFGGGPSSYGYYLTKGRGKVRLNLINSINQFYYQDNFRFIGWVLPGRK